MSEAETLQDEHADTWRDAKGREWKAIITLGVARKLRDAYRLDLLTESHWPGLGSLLSDLDRLGNVLWEVHREQAEAVGIDRESFDAGLNFDALNLGYWGVAAAFVNFCHPAARPGIATMLELEAEALAEYANERARQAQSQTTVGEFQQAVKDYLAETAG